MNAQVSSLLRVIEVATDETLNSISEHTFDLGMKLGQNRDVIKATKRHDENGKKEQLIELLNDPFINGFVGCSKVDLAKLRIFSLNLELIAESSMGLNNLPNRLDDYIVTTIFQRQKSDRLKAVDSIWLSPHAPMFSTMIPIGGLRPIGYLEVIVDPEFNLPDIQRITKTPVQTFSVSTTQVNNVKQEITDKYLPVEFILKASNGQPAFRIVGYEDIVGLNQQMKKTLSVTIMGFLGLALITLLIALFLFRRFLFAPLSRMIRDMQLITNGKLDLQVENKGLNEFHILANSFNTMTEQVRIRTTDLQRLLDLDNDALMCFDHENEAIYFNNLALDLFGYANDEISELDMTDFFVDDISMLTKNIKQTDTTELINPHITLTCKNKESHVFQCEATIHNVDVRGKYGLAIILNPHTSESRNFLSTDNEQRLRLVEKTLSSLLSIAKTNSDVGEKLTTLQSAENMPLKPDLRENTVKVMSLALSFWSQNTGKSKLDLAEESKIWPVYMDKSTPTTRTLDKYLNINSCPKNPRSQKVIDTVEFVIRNTRTDDNEKPQELVEALNTFRQILSGIK